MRITNSQNERRAPGRQSWLAFIRYRLCITTLVGLLLVCSLAVPACGVVDPDARASDWDETHSRVTRLIQEGQGEEALAVAEAFLKRNPDSVDAHLMLGTPLEILAESAKEPTRTAYLERFVTHHERVLELTKNPNFRGLALGRLVRVNLDHRLNRLDQAEKFQRRLIADHPSSAAPYAGLVALLEDANRAQEAAAFLIESVSAIAKDAEHQRTLSATLSDLAESPQLSKETKGQLLDQALQAADVALKTNRTDTLLQIKARILEAQAKGVQEGASRCPPGGSRPCVAGG